MDKSFKQDVKIALSSMFNFAILSLTELGKIVLAISVIVLVFGTFAYCFYNYFWQSLTVVVMAALSAWFYVELVNARITREYEEKEEAWRVEKSKPAHGDTK